MASKREKIYYKKSIITFDIETTSYVENVKQKNGKIREVKHAFMYIGAIYNNGVISNIENGKILFHILILYPNCV